jgi:hypothetical protein
MKQGTFETRLHELMTEFARTNPSIDRYRVKFLDKSQATLCFSVAMREDSAAETQPAVEVKT